MDERAPKQISTFRRLHPDLPKSSVVKHFKSLGYAESTIYRILKAVEFNQSVSPKKKSGRPKVRLTDSERVTIRRRTAGKVATSFRCLGEKYQKSPKTIKRILTDMNIVRAKRKIIPKVDKSQEKRQRQRLKQATKSSLSPSNDLVIVMDDESYFSLSRFAGNEHYYDDGKQVSEEVKYYRKKKFEEKYLMWVAISPKGRSEPLIMTSRQNVGGEIYRKHMIEERLKPFIDEMYPNGGYVFWPDLAAAHYAKATLQTMNELNIKFVPKDENPPACPELRPIESFWAHLKGRVYQDGWEAKNAHQLKSRIVEKLATFSDMYYHNLMFKCKAKVRRAATRGLKCFRP